MYSHAMAMTMQLTCTSTKASTEAPTALNGRALASPAVAPSQPPQNASPKTTSGGTIHANSSSGPSTPRPMEVHRLMATPLHI